MARSPFLDIPEAEWIASNSLAFAIFDRFPVSPGHALVITRREVATWFDADPAEQAAVWELVNDVKRRLDATLAPKPDGYNVGFNSGEAAGQTVMHLHVHVIPRYAGDVPDPRGGVRYVIPEKANYLREVHDERPLTIDSPDRDSLHLTTGHPDSPLWERLAWRITGAKTIDVLASFVQPSGLDVIESALFDALRNRARIRILVSDYLYISAPQALARLSGWCASMSDESGDGSLDARLIEVDKLPSKPASFHPKSWYVADDQGSLLSVGSSNLSRPALETGIEWNLLSSRSELSGVHARFVDSFEQLWNVASPLTPQVVARYAVQARSHRASNDVPESIDYRESLAPRTWQAHAMAALQRLRDAGYRRALVAVATGMGKTWLAAFDLVQVGRQLERRPRTLVVAHRAHILAQAETAVSQVLDPIFGESKTAWYIGDRSELDGELVVASIQKLSRPEGLARLANERFDYVVIDEVHHAHAPSYRRVLAQVQAEFILGLTATPERTDGVDVATIFDDNLAYHATIGDGIAEESLVPFHYIGLKDTVDFRQIPWRNGRFDLEELERRVLESERMNRLWSAMQQHPAQRTILFCCSRRHAFFTRDWLRFKGLSAAAVFSDGGDSRADSLRRLRVGELDALCVVDMFNEGLDIPAVDRVIMLRPTESKVIFLQQLGRGLRASEGKSRLLVIDFVGNHRIFAQRLIHLLALGGKESDWNNLKKWLKGEPPELPEGCLLDVELAARDMLKEFIPRGARAGIEAYRALRDELERRPTASELQGRDYSPKAVSKETGDWFSFVASEGDLTDVEGEVAEAFRDWLKTVETTSLNKSYKMVVLRVLLDLGAFFQEVHLPTFARQCRRFLWEHPVLRNDLLGEGHAIDHAHASDDAWATWWMEWPIGRWLTAQNGRQWFRQDGENFVFLPSCPEAQRSTLESLTGELVDYRLAAYVKRPRRIVGAFEGKVSHSGGRPILFLRDSSQEPTRPVGPTSVHLPDGSLWEFKLVKVACNVAWPIGEKENQLGELLRTWFGPDAGLPGTDFRVSFTNHDGEWHVKPIVAPPVTVARSSQRELNFDIKVEPSVPQSDQYRTHVPVYDLTAAAGGWGPEGVPEIIGWIPASELKLTQGMFAAQVTGRSMEPRIQDGQWCLFRPCPAGSRQNRLLLLQVNSHLDPEDGGRYTIKRFHSTKRTDEDGWQHETIELQPLNPEFSPIQLSPEQADEIRVVGEFVGVIGR